MRRREFIAGLGGAAAAWPLGASGQQSAKLARIGYLGVTSASANARYSDAFRIGLRNLGYAEGKNFTIDARFAEGNNDRLFDLAAELVHLNVDVIVAYGPGIPAAQRATSTVPIVMATYGDAVATGLITSLARPGGNVTGLTFFNPELMAKRLELLKELVPSMTQAGILLNPGTVANDPILQAMEMTAKALNVGLQPFYAHAPSEFEGIFAAIADKQIGAIVIQDHPLFITNANGIAALAIRRRLPSSGFLEWAERGGLTAYGVNFTDMFRRASIFVDKIVKGVRHRMF